ncbi:MAG: tRNA epoxyqueuosine(34) reductase QueG [Candidatus Binatia bacterium]|jgi:epoxyqueuosine reductase
MSDIKEALAALARRQGFVRMAVARAEEDAEARAITLERVRQGSFAGLPWFDEARVVRATDPRRTLPEARSLILLAASYWRPAPARRPDALTGRVARYAWGRDYHRVLEKRARPLVRLLTARDASARSRVLVDHGPLAERAYARTAGLGWQGKNTMLLARGIGSYTFLAAILTSVELAPDASAPQSCGACTRCLPVCPTGALRSEYELVNDLCIAYHTIENRGPIPRELRPRIGDWVFGCDLCQEACPVNDTGRPDGLPEFSATRSDDAFPDLVELLSLSEAEFRKRFAGRPLLRAKYAGLLRNACVALGNLGDARACGPLSAALDHPQALVRGHAAWALGRLASSLPLRARLAREADPWVREEILEALENAGG